jgi:hypothetical protein
MKKAIILSLIVQVFMGALNAQRTTGGAVFIKTGYLNLPGSACIFNKIAPSGITGFSNSFVAFGAEGYYRVNNLIFALNGDIGVQYVKLTDTRAAEALSGAGYVQVGHIIKENKRYWLYPSIGIGASAIGMNAYNQVNAVTSNEKINYLVNRSFDFGLNADFVLFGTQVEKKYSCLILGFRTGYRISYANDDWHG